MKSLESASTWKRLPIGIKIDLPLLIFPPCSKVQLGNNCLAHETQSAMCCIQIWVGLFTRTNLIYTASSIKRPRETATHDMGCCVPMHVRGYELKTLCCVFSFSSWVFS